MAGADAGATSMGSSSKMAWSMLLERGCWSVASGEEPPLWRDEEPLESLGSLPAWAWAWGSLSGGKKVVRI